jgi:hypothetical protein
LFEFAFQTWEPTCGLLEFLYWFHLFFAFDSLRLKIIFIILLLPTEQPIQERSQVGVL